MRPKAGISVNPKYRHYFYDGEVIEVSATIFDERGNETIVDGPLDDPDLEVRVEREETGNQVASDQDISFDYNGGTYLYSAEFDTTGWVRGAQYSIVFDGTISGTDVEFSDYVIVREVLGRQDVPFIRDIEWESGDDITLQCIVLDEERNKFDDQSQFDVTARVYDQDTGNEVLSDQMTLNSDDVFESTWTDGFDDVSGEAVFEAVVERDGSQETVSRVSLST